MRNVECGLKSALRFRHSPLDMILWPSGEGVSPTRRRAVVRLHPGSLLTAEVSDGCSLWCSGFARGTVNAEVAGSIPPRLPVCRRGSTQEGTDLVSRIHAGANPAAGPPRAFRTKHSLVTLTAGKRDQSEGGPIGHGPPLGPVDSVTRAIATLVEMPLVSVVHLPRRPEIPAEAPGGCHDDPDLLPPAAGQFLLKACVVRARVS